MVDDLLDVTRIAPKPDSASPTDAGPPAGRMAGDRRQSGALRRQRRPAGDEPRGRAGVRRRRMPRASLKWSRISCRTPSSSPPPVARPPSRSRGTTTTLPSCGWSTPGSGWIPRSCRGYSNHSYRPTAPWIDPEGAWASGSPWSKAWSTSTAARSVREAPGPERARSSRSGFLWRPFRLGSPVRLLTRVGRPVVACW